MTDTPTDDMPGFVAEEPEHCHACYRLIRPSQTYFLTVGQAILCEGCLEVADAIRVTDDLAVAIEDGRLLVRRGDATVEVFASEVQHLVDALVEAATRVVNQQHQGKQGSRRDSRQPALAGERAVSSCHSALNPMELLPGRHVREGLNDQQHAGVRHRQDP
jgi:hypothetical protein